MANEEQLKIWRQRVDVWNRWREENPTAIIDLSNATLTTQMVLTFEKDSPRVFNIGDNLSHANLRNANLSGAIVKQSQSEQCRSQSI